MNTRQFFLRTITYTLSVLALIALLVIVIDPFLHYHAPIGKLQAVETDERSAMAGVAKHLTYDTALIGSSMSENFRASWFEDGVFGTSCVKLCLQGAHFSDYAVMLNEVCSHQEVKNIVFSLDNYLLTNNPDRYPVTIPSYLANNNLLDDPYYVWNKSVVLEYIPKFLINNATETADDAYIWADDYQFSKYIARGVYTTQRVLVPEEEKSYDIYFAYADSFLHSIEPYLEERSDVTFYFYASPYSIYYWDDCVRHGNLTAEICTLERVYKQLLTHENVRLFYFQDDFDLITDLDHYRDYSHFDQSVNHMMYECMRDGKKEVSQDDYYDTLLGMNDFAMHYDYESAFH
ncbi:MAG: hypothetical protein K6D90_08185 [Lachnospiraceae bacterium]|nr:hypothetical protein [Lachnospiraceae bacterium]